MRNKKLSLLTKMIAPIVFDIETGPRSREALLPLMPEFSAPSNWKDPAKIEACIKEKEEAWLEKAALDASTGRVLAIGIRQGGTFEALTAEDERELLTRFWKRIAPEGEPAQKVIGFNSHRFDLPFLVRRSWMLRVSVPDGLLEGRYRHPAFVDLYEIWQCYDRTASINLDTMAKALGVGAKNGEGKHFHILLQSDRKKAIEYLKNDLLMTENCAVVLGAMKAPALVN